jgi:hypothetical protein
VSGPVFKSAGDLEDNQLWEVPVAGYPATSGYDATTGWGTPERRGVRLRAGRHAVRAAT